MSDSPWLPWLGPHERMQHDADWTIRHDSGRRAVRADVGHGEDGRWWWMASIDRRGEGLAQEMVPLGHTRAGPALGYATDQEARAACEAWLARELG